MRTLSPEEKDLTKPGEKLAFLHEDILPISHSVYSNLQIHASHIIHEFGNSNVQKLEFPAFVGVEQLNQCVVICGKNIITVAH